MRGVLFLLALLLVPFAAPAQPVGAFSQGPVGNSCSTPLDAVSDTFPFAGGVRKLRNAYSGFALNVTLSGTATDIGFSGCDLNTSALSGCTTADTCPVNTIYDQSGHAVNCTQTGTNRPSVLINIQNGHPAIHFNVTNSEYCSGTFGSSIGAAQAFIAGDITSIADNRAFFSWGTDGTARQFVWYSTSLADCTMTNNSSVNATSGVICTNEWGRYVGSSETNLTGIFFGGTTHGPASGKVTTAVTPASGTPFRWGARIGTADLFMAGDIGEILVVAPTISSCIGTNSLGGDCATISSNQKTYYNIAN